MKPHRTSPFAANTPETNVFVFLSKTLLHIFQITGSLSDQDIVPGHVERLVSHAMAGLGVPPEQAALAPRLDNVTKLAENVLEELEQTYGDKLNYTLLDQSPCVEAMVVLCLQKHAKKMFEEMNAGAAAAECAELTERTYCDWQLCLASFGAGFIAAMCGKTLYYYSQYFH